MTELTITPKLADKTARFKGTVAAGEHVAVTIKGGAEWLGEDDGANLTLRLLDMVTGRSLAVFPRPAETLEDGETQDAWSVSSEDANDLYCELNLNTTRMVAAARHMLRVPVLFVLGDTDDSRTLYFKDRHEVEYWPERIGDTVPYDLDKWPKQIDEWKELVAGFGETLDGHVGNNVRHITESERATWNGKVSPSALAAYVNAAAYDTVTKKILLKNGNLIVSEIDASDFVKDGMVSSVVVVGENLVITFNTDAGKSPISIPLSDFAVQQVQSDWNQQDSSKKDFIKNKPTIPAAQVNADWNATEGKAQILNKPTIPAPVDISGKLDGVAAYPAWDSGTAYEYPDIVSYDSKLWRAVSGPNGYPGQYDGEWELVTLDSLKQDALTAAQLANIAAVPTKANESDVNAALAQKADAENLPYALVVPGEWEFSGVPDGVSNYSLVWDDGWFFAYYYEGESYGDSVPGAEDALELSFIIFGSTVTATRPSLPGHLCDRAANAVSISSATTLTLPAANPGHSRDLYVRLTVSATSAVTWAIAQGESWDAMGAPPSSFTAGTYLYRFTEVAPGTWHCEDMLALAGLEATLAGKMPQYSMVAVAPSSGTLTVAPYTEATYTAGSSAEAFTVAVGAGTTGKARDCILVIDGSATGAVAPTVTWPATFHPRTDAGTDFACEAGVRNVYYISEYAQGEFVVGGWQETAGGNA